MLSRKMQTLFEGNETVTPEKNRINIDNTWYIFATIFLFCSPDKYSFSTDSNEPLLWPILFWNFYIL
jgi:hypothetical protein